MSRKLFISRDNEGRYSQRRGFSRTELLPSLTEEMNCAQTQIPGNVHCDGLFSVGYSGFLQCTIGDDRGRHRIYYDWDPQRKMWSPQQPKFSDAPRQI